MTRTDLLEIFNGTPDGPMRFLRLISNEGERRMFAGNHRSREALLKAGFISLVERSGQHYQLNITDNGRVALAADKLISTISQLEHGIYEPHGFIR